MLEYVTLMRKPTGERADMYFFFSVNLWLWKMGRITSTFAFSVWGCWWHGCFLWLDCEDCSFWCFSVCFVWSVRWFGRVLWLDNNNQNEETILCFNLISGPDSCFPTFIHWICWFFFYLFVFSSFLRNSSLTRFGDARQQNTPFSVLLLRKIFLLVKSYRTLLHCYSLSKKKEKTKIIAVRHSHLFCSSYS